MLTIMFDESITWEKIIEVIPVTTLPFPPTNFLRSTSTLPGCQNFYSMTLKHENLLATLLYFEIDQEDYCYYCLNLFYWGLLLHLFPQSTPLSEISVLDVSIL